MTSFSCRSFAPIAISCVLATICSDAFAQRSRTPPRRSVAGKRESDANAKARAKAAASEDRKIEANTTVTVEILTGDDAGGSEPSNGGPFSTTSVIR